MSAADDKLRIWDSYWRDSRLHSVGADSDPLITTTLDQQWGAVAEILPVGARVLDLGCGNGSASVALLRAAQATGAVFNVVGIDSAAINPSAHVTEHADALSRVEFHGNTRMEHLPFPDATFDAVISQFGIEYGERKDTLGEVSRVLKPGGLLVMLALPARSAAVKSAQQAVKQCRLILRESAMFDIARAVANAPESGPPGSAQRDYLERFTVEAEKVTRKFGPEEGDVVLSVIVGLNRIFIDRKTTSPAEQLTAIETLRTRLAEFAARSQAMTRAALSDGALEDLKRTMAAAQLRITETRSIIAGTHGVIAWRLVAQRLAS